MADGLRYRWTLLGGNTSAFGYNGDGTTESKKTWVYVPKVFLISSLDPQPQSTALANLFVDFAKSGLCDREDIIHLYASVGQKDAQGDITYGSPTLKMYKITAVASTGITLAAL